MIPKKGLALILAKGKGDEEGEEMGADDAAKGLEKDLKDAIESKDYGALLDVIKSVAEGCME